MAAADFRLPVLQQLRVLLRSWADWPIRSERDRFSDVDIAEWRTILLFLKKRDLYMAKFAGKKQNPVATDSRWFSETPTKNVFFKSSISMASGLRSFIEPF